MKVIEKETKICYLRTLKYFFLTNEMLTNTT